jgi:D-psicose/D-tagatose/L-ribulose 3-epimerase
MKYGIHLSTFCKDWFEDLTPHIIMSKELGYDGVEFPLIDPFTFDVKKYVALTKEVQIQGLCSTGLNTNADISSLDSSIRNQGISHLKKCIDIAQQLNSPYVTGVTYSPWGFVQSKEKGKQHITNIIESMKEVADYAKSANVNVYLEILNRFESYVINTIDEGIELISEIQRNNVGLHFDTFHAHIEEKDVYNAIVKGGKSIKHVHFSENDRGLPLTGQVNWSAVVKGLKEISYNEWICLESFVMTNTEVGNGTMVWRNVDGNGNYVAKHGLINMKRIMNDEII